MNKEKIMKILKSKIFIGVIAFGLGGAFYSDTTEVSNLEKSVTTLSDQITTKEEEITAKEEEIKGKDSKISELQAKVDEAKPWFEMKEEERKAEEERIVQEKTAKEAEEKAKEEEQRKAEEKARKEAESKKYETGITYDNLARNPGQNIGKLVKFKGKILQVINSDRVVQYRMAVNNNYDKVILIEIDKSKLLDGNILEDDTITIEGQFIKEMDYETVMGATRTIPAVLVDNVYR